MFSAIISVAYAHCPVTVQSCECNCSMHVLRHAHALHSGSPPNVLHSPSIIGASLSEPHTSVTSLRRACVSMLACLLACHLANTVNFKSANFPCTCTIIFKFNNELASSQTHLDTTPDSRNREPSSYLFNGR